VASVGLDEEVKGSGAPVEVSGDEGGGHGSVQVVCGQKSKKVAGPLKGSSAPRARGALKSAS
jgi:hypothetical protein